MTNAPGQVQCAPTHPPFPEPSAQGLATSRNNGKQAPGGRPNATDLEFQDGFNPNISPPFVVVHWGGFKF